MVSTLQTRPTDPSLQSLLSFVAVTHAQRGDEILGQLLLQCSVMLPGESLATGKDSCSILTTLFGLDVNPERAQATLDKLAAKGQISRPLGSPNYTVNAVLRSRSEKSERLIRPSNSCVGDIAVRSGETLATVPELTNAGGSTLLLRLASRKRACTVVLFVRAVHHW